MPSAPLASLIAAVILIAMSAWGYVDADTKSVTILIPAIAGVILLLCYPGVKAENKIVAHIAVLVTLLILIALMMPLSRAVSGGEVLPAVRVGAMVGAVLVALIAFIQSFIAARKARQSE